MKYDIVKLTRLLFPWFWQNTENLALVDTVASSLEFSNNRLSTVEDEYNLIVGYSIQRLSLETSLNNRFDNTARRIRVVNGNIGGNEYAFNESENPLPSDISFIYNESETINPEDEAIAYNENEDATLAVTGFTVFAPQSVQGVEQSIKAWVNRVNITGIKFKIEYT